MAAGDDLWRGAGSGLLRGRVWLTGQGAAGSSLEARWPCTGLTSGRYSESSTRATQWHGDGLLSRGGHGTGGHETLCLAVMHDGQGNSLTMVYCCQPLGKGCLCPINMTWGHKNTPPGSSSGPSTDGAPHLLCHWRPRLEGANPPCTTRNIWSAWYKVRNLIV